jgi:hypothetical protein
MKKIIRRTKDSYGNETPTAVLIQENGLLRLWEVVCLSSQFHNLGNCQCVNHSATEEVPVTTQEVVRRFGAEALDGFGKSGYEQKVFDAFGIEAHELETFCRISYRLGLNPIPILRSVTKCEVDYSENPENLTFTSDKKPNDIIFIVNSQGRIFVNETYLQPVTSS